MIVFGAIKCGCKMSENIQIVQWTFSLKAEILENCDR